MDAPGCGTYRVWTKDRFANTETARFSDHSYSATFAYGFGTTTASVSVNTEISCPDLSSVIPGRDELVFTRLGDDEDAAWIGPILAVAEQPDGVAVITAADRSWWASDPDRGRTWKSTRTVSDDAAQLVAAGLAEANLWDNIGLGNIEVARIQQSVTRELVAGRAIRTELALYSGAVPWCVIGGTAYVGLIEADTGLDLDRTHFIAGAAQPTVSDSLNQRTNRVAIELADGQFVIVPESLADVTLEGTGGLVERALDLSREPVTVAEANVIAGQLLGRGQHGLQILGTGEVSEHFPIPLRDIRPGLIIGVRSLDLGSTLDTGDLVQVDSVVVEIGDDRELTQRVSFGPSFLGDRPVADLTRYVPIEPIVVEEPPDIPPPEVPEPPAPPAPPEIPDPTPEPSATPAPTVPGFNTAGALLINPGQNWAAEVAAAPAGSHIRVVAGTHAAADVSNVEMKAGMHLQIDGGVVISGAGQGYFIRPESPAADDVVIGGAPAGPRPIISDYGLGSSAEGYGAIMGRTDDILDILAPGGDSFIYTDVNNWFIYGLAFDTNASNAILLGSNFTVYNCDIRHHTVTGIGGNRVVGGLIHSNTLHGNALDPATGNASNGASIKLVWMNADPGRLTVAPTGRTKARTIISSNVVESPSRLGVPGGSARGLWLDLDCQDVLMEYNQVDDHPNFALLAEGCNNIEIAYNTGTNSNGFGPAYGTNFRAAAITLAETTNANVHHNTLIGCDYALMNRLSNRSVDWLDPGGSFNYGVPSGPRYWLLNTIAIPPVNGQSNIWTGANRFADNTLIDCNRVVINEGNNTPEQITQGATDVSTLTFERNNYDGSPAIAFYDRSNTPLTLAQWQALGRQ